MISFACLPICIFLLSPFSHADATNRTSEAVSNTTLAASLTTPVSNATKTVDFSSAVQIASSVSLQVNQLTSIPAIPIPTDLTNLTWYEAVSRLAPAMPPIQSGFDFKDAAGMVADLISWTNTTDTGNSLVGRQSGLRVMVVGDSMTQGQQGDWTWRYRIWQWFKQNGIAVQFVGPYAGTLSPPNAMAPSPPPLYGMLPTPTPPITTGGYAKGVDAAFLSNSKHFAIWGRAAAVDKGLINTVVQQNPADLMLLMLGFNDMGWFYSDAQGTIDSIGTLITNARAANPNLKFAVANVVQRSFIGGRQDLVDKTNTFNSLLPGEISKWSTTQSPVHLVKLREAYDCEPGSCPAGYDGLHPNAYGEFQIAHAFSQTLVNDFKMGTSLLAVPAPNDPAVARNLPVPSNFKVFSSPQGVTATWDPVYGAYGYDLQVSINGGGAGFSASSTSFNRWDSTWALQDWTYAVSVRASAGDYIKGAYTSTMSAAAKPQLAPPPVNVNVQPTAEGFTVTWDPPTGPYTDSIVEYNVLFWDSAPDDCQYILGAAFTHSPAVLTGMKPGVNYLVAVVTWNQYDQGLPFIANNVVTGGSTPPVPSNLQINSNDPTTAQKPTPKIANVTGSTCNDEYFLFPGVWNYAFAVSAFNGNVEGPKGPELIAPSPAGTAAGGGPTCPAPGPWCPGGGQVSVPPVGGGGGGTPTTSGGAGGGTSSTTGAGAPTNTNYPTVTNDHCSGPDCYGGQCSGLLCASFGCIGIGCSSGWCLGLDCTVNGCVGPNCRDGVCTGSGCVTNGCVGSDCNGSGHCEGFNCIAIGCAGPDCAGSGICIGPNCSEETCSGPDCLNGACVGPSCVSEGTVPGGGSGAPLSNPIPSPTGSVSSTTSDCAAQTVTNVWLPTDPNGYAPSLGAGGIFGYTYVTGAPQTSAPPKPTNNPWIARIYACFSNLDAGGFPVTNLFWSEYDFTADEPKVESGAAFCDGLQARTTSMGPNGHFTDFPKTFAIPGTVQGLYTSCTYFDPKGPDAGVGSMTCGNLPTPVSCPTVTAKPSQTCLDESQLNLIAFAPLADCSLPIYL